MKKWANDWIPEVNVITMLMLLMLWMSFKVGIEYFMKQSTEEMTSIINIPKNATTANAILALVVYLLIPPKIMRPIESRIRAFVKGIYQDYIKRGKC